MSTRSPSCCGSALPDAALQHLLSRLRRKGSYLRSSQIGGVDFRLHLPGARGRTQEPPRIDPGLVAEGLRRGWLAGSEGAEGVLRLSELGALVLARGLSSPRRPQVGAVEREGQGCGSDRGRARLRSGTTVQRLRKLATADGKPLLEPFEADAAERLSADFQLGGMTPRVTARWDPAATVDRRTRASGPFAPEAGLTASQVQARVRAALAAVGGE